ncbi:hypothetical protein HAX54_008566 [Datura stramonium]|uniref:Pentatricopeptide repeat-containing protein n=1 Tax=Datura stramonium TaxID=4076 RepID=A0ABS8RW82_DATST|nr:hypothetical protein [Datura stramonium]
MRERISPAEAGISYCTLEINFNKDAYIVRVMCLDGQLGAALSLWWNMIQNSIVPDVITHNYLINGLCKNGELEKAEWIVRDVYSYNTLVGALSRQGKTNDACYIHDVMTRMGVIPGQITESLEKEMLLYGLTPDSVTYNLLIGAACNLGLIHSALQLHDKMLRKGCQPDKKKLLQAFAPGWLTNFRSRSVVPITAAVFVSWRLDASVSHVMKLLSTEPATQKLALPWNMVMETLNPNLRSKIDGSHKAARWAVSLTIVPFHGMFIDHLWVMKSYLIDTEIAAGFRNLALKIYRGHPSYFFVPKLVLILFSRLGHRTVPREMHEVCNWLSARLGLDGS